MRPSLRLLCCLLALSAGAAACGEVESPSGETATVVVTTSLLGDVVGQIAGDALDVIVVMPPGADPHDFSASARQVDALQRADAIVANGGGLEPGLDDIVASAAEDGVPVFWAVDAVVADGSLADDPHFFTDPNQMREVVDSLASFLSALDGVDRPALDRSASAYVADLVDLDATVEATLAVIPAERRILVTSHDVFGHFAQRYGFRIVGSVTGATTDAAPDARRLAALAAAIEDNDVPALFADAASGDDLARTVAEEVGGVAVVPLFTESIGAPDSDAPTYLDMVRVNAERIASALDGVA